MDKMKISVIGAGKVGTVLGCLISRSGFSFCGLYSKNKNSSEKAIKYIGKGKVFSSIADLVRKSGVIVIAVDDSEVKNVAGEIVEESRLRKIKLVGKVCVHTSGALSSSILLPLSKAGCSVASLHPLQAIASVDSGIALIKDSYFCIEGERNAVAIAQRIVKKIGGTSFQIEPAHKHAYHLAACFLSNYIVSLSDMIIEKLLPPTRSKNEWLKIFAPLIRGTAENLKAKGIPDALTGPISRGDSQTIQRHFEALKDLDPDLRKLHRILAQRAVEIAIRQGHLSKEKKNMLIRLFRMKKNVERK